MVVPSVGTLPWQVEQVLSVYSVIPAATSSSQATGSPEELLELDELDEELLLELDEELLELDELEDELLLELDEELLEEDELDDEPAPELEDELELPTITPLEELLELDDELLELEEELLELDELEDELLLEDTGVR